LRYLQYRIDLSSTASTKILFADIATEIATHGVAERFNRRLKEQVIHGSLFRNLEEVRAAVTAFRDRYNRHWRLEKLGLISPLEARQAYAMRKAA
jgi:transposase InsO family protein